MFSQVTCISIVYAEQLYVLSAYYIFGEGMLCMFSIICSTQETELLLRECTSVAHCTEI